MILEINKDEENYGWRFHYKTDSEFTGFDWCPYKNGIYYYRGNILPNFLHCVLGDHFTFFEKDDYVLSTRSVERFELQITKIAFEDTLEQYDY